MPQLPDAENIAGALSTLDEAVALARSGNRRWGLFAALYREVTRAVDAEVTANTFDDGDRMSRFIAIFANRYFQPLREHLTTEASSKSWRIAFEAAERADVTALQHLLLGINAHINFDLALAVVDAGGAVPEFRADFLRINDILADVLDKAQAALNTFSPLLSKLDALLGAGDERLGMFILERARDQAWIAAHGASTLSSEARFPFEATLDAGTAHLGRRLADPGLPTSAAIHLILLQERWTVPELLDAFSSS